MVNKILAHTKTLVIVSIAIGFFACSGNVESNTEVNQSPAENKKETGKYTPESLNAVIMEMEDAIQNPTTPDKEDLRTDLAGFYQSYYTLFSGDSLAPDMLFRAGNMYVNLNRFDEALAMYSTIENKFRGYQKRPESIYLEGFIYDTYKNEFGNAKEKYQILIKDYPNHELAEQAKQSIENLGLTDEEIIRKFEKNLK